MKPMSEHSRESPEPESVRYQFGTFELDGRSGELRKNGVRMRLQEQPFLVLRKLLEGSGELVTREELHATVWQADTFVDFDTSLNTAIKRLREALSDSADMPIFIETVPRRGYRFLAPVKILQATGSLKAQGSLEKTTAIAGAPPPITRGFRVASVAAGIFLLIAVIAVAVAVRAPKAVPYVVDTTQMTFGGNPKGNVHAGGGFIYYNEDTGVGERLSLLKLPAAGGTPTVLDTSAPGMSLTDVSTDGRKLLIVIPSPGDGPYPLKILDTTSGSLQDLNGVQADDAAFRPDGKLVFANRQDVYFADADGLHPQKLFSMEGYVNRFRFSPDGTKMRFSVNSKLSGQREIWETRGDGTGLTRALKELTQADGEPCCGVWSADGRYYFFGATLNGASRVWVQPQRNSFWSKGPARAQPLTSVPPNFYVEAGGPAASKLLVTASEPRAELARYDQKTKKFVPLFSGISAGDAEYTRDGKFIAYVRYPDGTLWRARADGSEAAQLTGPSLRVSLPHWSPDGQRIAFSGTRPGRPWNIYVISAAGGPAEQLTNGAFHDLDATWSPDGTKLAFGEERRDGKSLRYSIKELDLASRRVTDFQETEGICCPRWSLDGTTLMATHATYDDIVLYDLETHEVATVVQGVGTIGYMAWMADGKTILFDTISSVPDPSFYRVRAGGRPEQVVNLKDVRRYYGDFGMWSGIAPDGSPLLVRDISDDEVYALDLLLP